jgi:hypothetical protein
MARQTADACKRQQGVDSGSSLSPLWHLINLGARVGTLCCTGSGGQKEGRRRAGEVNQVPRDLLEDALVSLNAVLDQNNDQECGQRGRNLDAWQAA